MVPVLDAVVLDPHDNGGHLLISLNVLVEEIGFVAFTKVSENLGANLATGEHGGFGLITLFNQGNVRIDRWLR